MPAVPISIYIHTCTYLPQATAQYLVNLNVWTHNLLVVLGRSQGKGHVHCTTQHCWKRWMAASVFVVAYSYGISMTVPFFTTLVGGELD